MRTADPRDPSKYMADAADLQGRYDADGVLVMVIGGRLGHGGCPAFKVINGADGNPDTRAVSAAAERMAKMMRFIADDLEKRFVREWEKPQ